MRILVAEDSHTPRVMLQRAVVALGHECHVAEDGLEAWERYREHGADVIISDWMMPGLDGDELCRRVRDHMPESYTYFIILTSLDDVGYVVRGMEAGADDYLRKPFNHEELRARLIAGRRVTELHERLAAQQQTLEELNLRLFDESRRDQLTRLGNRIALREHLAELTSDAARYGRTYAVALFDVDSFKLYNDSCGHLAGDEALQTVAGVIDGGRTGDRAFRYGGEEMLVVLPEQGAEEAALVAERIRMNLEALAVPHPGRGEGAVVTVSAGVAALDERDREGSISVIDRADAALYRAKELGRNRVEVDSCTPIGAAST